MDKLAQEDAKVTGEREGEEIKDKKTLAKASAEKSKLEREMAEAKAKFAQKEKKDETGEDLSGKAEKRAAKERKIVEAETAAKAAPKPRKPLKGDGYTETESEDLAGSG